MNIEAFRDLPAEEVIPELMNYLVTLGTKADVVKEIQEKLENSYQAGYTNGWFDAKQNARKQY